MYRTIIIRDKQRFNISEVIENLSWADSVDTLGMSLNFNIINKILYSGNFVVNEGDAVLVTNTQTKKEIFRGIIVSKSVEEYSSSITALDYAFYLNQSKTIIQFNKSNATDAIKQLCNKFNVPIHSIVSIPTLITKIYKDKTIAEIIVDILEQATLERGIKYRIEMNAGKLYIEEYKNLVVKGNIQLAKNLGSISLVDTIGTITSSSSIMEMKNSILVTSDGEESSKIIATAKDNNNIAKFGLLQDIITVDDKNESQARNIAQNALKESNKIDRDISIEALGDDTIRAGRQIELNLSMHNLKGKYLIKSCTHTYSNNNHKVSLTLGAA